MLPDRSVLIGQKLVENAKIEKLKCDILGDFQTLCLWSSPLCFNFFHFFEGIFGVESDTRLIFTGRNRRSYGFQLDTGFTNYPRAELNHRNGAAFAAPDGTYACDE